MTVDELLDLLPDPPPPGGGPPDERPVVILLDGDVYDIADVKRYEDAFVVETRDRPT